MNVEGVVQYPTLLMLFFDFLKGSHSTKVEAVVRTLKRIQFKDPGAKSLVFSTVLINHHFLSCVCVCVFKAVTQFSGISLATEMLNHFVQPLDCFENLWGSSCNWDMNNDHSQQI